VAESHALGNDGLVCRLASAAHDGREGEFGRLTLEPPGLRIGEPAKARLDAAEVRFGMERELEGGLRHQVKIPGQIGHGLGQGRAQDADVVDQPQLADG